MTSPCFFDTALTLALVFMAVVVVVIAASAREWWLVLTNRKAAVVHEGDFVQSAYAIGD